MHDPSDQIAPSHRTLSAQGISKHFGKRQVLNGIDVSLRSGEIVGLLGPNGAGKTTLFMILCGLLTPDKGKVSMDGADVSMRPLFWRAQNGLGYLPQESSVFCSLSVEQNIASVLQRRPLSKNARQERLETLLSEFGLNHVRKSKGGSLSGGERRRTEVARCLANDPNYVLLDEPFAGVDPIAVAEVRDLIVGLAEKGIGVLITDHNVQGTLKAVDRATILFDGKTLATGSPNEILHHDRVRDVYLGKDFSLV